MIQNKLSVELKFLVERSRETLCQYTKNESFTINNKMLPDWNKIYYLASSHSLLPLVYLYFKNNQLNITDIQKYKIDYSENAVGNLFSSVQFSEINKILTTEKIEFLPYKGHVFLEKLYSGKQLRSVGDLDLVVKPEFAKKALNILIQNGYRFYDISLNLNISIEKLTEMIPETSGMNETTLKKNINGTNHFIDFHWGFYYSFLPYKVDIDYIFENKTTIKVNNVDCVAPSDEALFIMLIIHHGGRDVWMKLKFMADLLAFMEAKGDLINWAEMLVSLTKMKLKRPMLVGFYILKNYFKYEIPMVIEAEFEKEKINEKLVSPIIDYWENCYNILSIKGRLKYEKILWSIQDEGFSRWNYVKEMFKMYSIPNPIESKRLITFPDNYYFLNSISKIITYLYKRSGKIVR